MLRRELFNRVIFTSDQLVRMVEIKLVRAWTGWPWEANTPTARLCSTEHLQLFGNELA
jgi:hypothetical protein